MSDNELLEVLRELEIELQRKSTRHDHHRLHELLHSDFTEIGRSGRVYSRQETVKLLIASDTFAQIDCRDFKVNRLSDTTALLTYRSARVSESGELKRCTLRSSIWQHGEEGWQLHFHQGTPAFEAW